MEDVAVASNYSSPRFSNNASISEALICTKCAEVEIQLHQVLEELSSAQLIIQMLKKESAPEDATTTTYYTGDRELCMTDAWKVKSTNDNKGRPVGKIKIRNNEMISSKSEALETKYRYSVLTTDDGMHERKNITNINENSPKSTNNRHKTIPRLDKEKCLNATRPQKELQKGAGKRLNPQNQSISLRQCNASVINETNTIPIIINGRITRKISTTTSNPRTTLIRERKSNTDYQHATQTQARTNHNLLLLGDSHTRGLAERIGCSLQNSFSVTGITKPNADINGITSPRHFAPNNLTNPSTWGHLIPSSYCDVGRFPARYLTFELNCAGIYSN